MDSYFKVYYNLKKLCRILIDNLTLFKNINFIYITHNMAQKSVEKTYISQVQKQSFSSLNELSISSIKQKHTNESSLDFSQEKHLLNQINIGTSEMRDQYGLAKPAKAFVFTKKQKQGSQISLLRGSSLSRLHNFQNLQKNLCFNKQIKRKKISSKSKDKILQPSSLLTTCHSLKQLKSSMNSVHSNKYFHNQIKTEISHKPYIDVTKMSKTPCLSLKIYEAPLDCHLFIQKCKNFTKIYHQLPDDFKVQLNDLTNWRKDLQYNCDTKTRKLQRSEDSSLKSNQRKHVRSLMTMDMRRSWQSKPEQRSPKCYQTVNKPSKKSQIYTQDGRHVVQLLRPIPFDCKSSSFYSSRTEQYQSPISQDSASTAECRVVRRNQMCRTPQQNCYGYFEPFRRSKNCPK